MISIIVLFCVSPYFNNSFAKIFVVDYFSCPFLVFINFGSAVCFNDFLKTLSSQKHRFFHFLGGVSFSKIVILSFFFTKNNYLCIFFPFFSDEFCNYLIFSFFFLRKIIIYFKKRFLSRRVLFLP